MSEAAPVRSRRALGFVALVLVAYGGGIVFQGGLSFEPIKDEAQFWDQARAFAEIWPPSIDEIRNYEEPMTPVAFLVWAGLESLHGLGIAAARIVTILASLAVLVLIAAHRPRDDTSAAVPWIAALGLLLFPYWIPMSLLLYTDVPASLFVVLGFWLYVRERHLAAGLVFAIAIGTRQYAVVFPTALVAFEGLAVLRHRELRLGRWVPYALAAASLLGWHAFFGGWGPPQGLEKWPRHSSALLAVQPGYALYMLATLGAYFAAYELVLERRWRRLVEPIGPAAIAALVAVAIGFALFTPNYPEGAGPLNRLLLIVLGNGTLGEAIRIGLLLGLAGLCVVRFAGFGLGTWVVGVQLGLMPFVWSPWEKYAMPVLASLWFLKATGHLDAKEPSR